MNFLNVEIYLLYKCICMPLIKYFKVDISVFIFVEYIFLIYHSDYLSFIKHRYIKMKRVKFKFYLAVKKAF